MIGDYIWLHRIYLIKLKVNSRQRPSNAYKILKEYYR